MNTRATIRRMALVGAGALAVLPLTAGAATAQSAEDCQELAAISDELVALCEEVAGAIEGDDDNGDDPDGDGPTGTPLDGLLEMLDPDELAALCDEAPEELEAVFGPVCDALTDGNGDPDEEAPEDDPDEVEATDPGTGDGEVSDTTDPQPQQDELPQTGGLAGLAGLGLLGAGVALRRLRAGDGHA